ncbi:DNA sulfur modification protein DndB [Brevibacillus sp. AG]|uniref:DNA sulfur modification protein DndB n=1 Tax=Brevibacillus sp. AG TaxID=3020891 RepID=UPI00232D0EAB|nr:DNA sulfur modification protein DndB [Brevibacillus sp. AG]MDC0764151.1 DNA sulfur modification protein DndB [Brevibacillus sp. AG]
MEKKEVKFLTTEIDCVAKRVSTLISLFESNKIIIDPEAQRKLSKAHMKEIAAYLRQALEGKTYGAYFPALTASRRENGVEAILDGQHRFFGAWEAVKQIAQEIEVIDTILKDEGKGKTPFCSVVRHQITNPSEQIHDVKLKGKVSELTDLIKKEIQENGTTSEISDEDVVRVLERHKDKLVEHSEIILNSVIPIVVYVGLSIQQEQQAFHDFNQKGKKVAKALAISFNHSDPMVNLSQVVCHWDSVKNYVQPIAAGSKLKDEYLFLFSTVYSTVATFYGSVKPNDINHGEMITDLEDFFNIVTNSIIEEDGSILKHAGTLPGIALFVRKLKEANGVSWRNTLIKVLETVPFHNKNTQFVRFGGAAVNADQTVRFSGSNGATSAVFKTLLASAQLLDEDGNEVLTAYESIQKQEPVIIVSEEKAQERTEELKEMQEEAGTQPSQNLDSENDLSGSESTIINALKLAEDNSIRGSYTQFAKTFNLARSTVTDSIRKLENKKLISIEVENEQKILSLL